MLFVISFELLAACMKSRDKANIHDNKQKSCRQGYQTICKPDPEVVNKGVGKIFLD